MRPAASGLALLALALLPGAAAAQAVPAGAAAPIPAVAPRPDSANPSPPTFVADTSRQVTVVTAEPPDVVTRRSAWRIGAAIAVLTLITLLLYNVRSR